MAGFRYSWIAVLLLFLLSSCTPQATGRAVKATDAQSKIMLYCSLGSELRVSELNGRSRTCFDHNLDLLQVAVESYDRSVVGITIEITGTNSSTNISYHPSERGAVFHYAVPDVSRKVGTLKALRIYPVVQAESRKVTCTQHPLNVEIEEC